jgi:hypothetical protein
MLRSHFLAAFFTLLSITSAQADEPTRVALTLHPAVETVPALKYRLLPSFYERRRGNAAPMYCKAMLVLGKNTADDLTRQKLLAGPLADCTMEAVNPVAGDSLVELVTLAALREHCQWELPLHEQNAVMIMLPELQEMRRLASVVLLRARTRVAKGDFAGAVKTLQIVYAMARHTAESPVLIGGLVGQSIQAQADKLLLEMVQRPAAPNLFWALAALPRPLVDERHGLDGESHFLEFAWKWWSTLPEQTPREDELDGFLNDYVTIFSLASTESGLAPTADKAGAVALAMLRTAGRREEIRSYVIRAGVGAERLKGLTDLQLAFLYTRLKYDELRDDSFRWASLPYAEAKAGLAKAGERLQAVKASGEEVLPLAGMILPALSQAKLQFARAERRIDVLRLIEALRIYAAGRGGRLPKSLEELAATPIPRDAITGQAMDYRLEDTGATLTLPEELPGGKSLVYEIRMAAKK